MNSDASTILTDRYFFISDKSLSRVMMPSAFAEMAHEINFSSPGSLHAPSTCLLTLTTSKYGRTSCSISDFISIRERENFGYSRTVLSSSKVSFEIIGTILPFCHKSTILHSFPLKSKPDIRTFVSSTTRIIFFGFLPTGLPRPPLFQSGRAFSFFL